MIYLDSRKKSVRQQDAYCIIRSDYARLFRKASEQVNPETVLKRRLKDVSKLAPETPLTAMRQRDEQEWHELLLNAHRELSNDYKKYRKDWNSTKRQDVREILRTRVLQPAEIRLKILSNCLERRGKIAKDLTKDLTRDPKKD